jgi:AcrR family transcriptional regulator
VAREAKVSKALIFWHFESKDHLFREVVSHTIEPYAINLDLDGLSEPDQLAQIIERGQQRGTLSGRVRAAAHASLLLAALNGTLVEGFVSDRKVPAAETAIAELKEALIDPIRVG